MYNWVLSLNLVFSQIYPYGIVKLQESLFQASSFVENLSNIMCSVYKGLHKLFAVPPKIVNVYLKRGLFWNNQDKQFCLLPVDFLKLKIIKRIMTKRNIINDHHILKKKENSPPCGILHKYKQNKISLSQILNKHFSRNFEIQQTSP